MHWTSIFTSRLGNETKLVGSTISCGATKREVNGTEMRRRNPHVQSYLLATDRKGMQVLQEEGNILTCHQTISDAIWMSELGASAVRTGGKGWHT